MQSANRWVNGKRACSHRPVHRVPHCSLGCWRCGGNRLLMPVRHLGCSVKVVGRRLTVMHTPMGGSSRKSCTLTIHFDMKRKVGI